MFVCSSGMRVLLQRIFCMPCELSVKIQCSCQCERPVVITLWNPQNVRCQLQGIMGINIFLSYKEWKFCAVFVYQVAMSNDQLVFTFTRG